MKANARGRAIAWKLGATATAGVVAWLALESAARACSCVQPPGPRAAAADASVVFEGRTFGVHREAGKVRFTFEVSRVFKGDVGASVDVYSPSAASMCGRAFEAGVAYLVYARTSPAGVLVDSMCSRTRASRAAAEDFAELGVGVGPPQPDAPANVRPSVEAPRIELEPTPIATRARGCTIAGAHAWWLALLPLLATRRRRPLPAPESRP